MKISTKILIGLAGLVVLMQVIPLERDNPPEGQAFAGPAEVEAILARACYDCHSNRTSWPWYSYVAPISFLVVHDVHEGREALNFSDWEGGPVVAAEILEEVSGRDMPLGIYLPLHPEAAVSPADIEVLRGFFATNPAD